ncbi:hypothetical protein F8B43_5307 [Methylorubrum populi]|uniref:Uncharacterized protein n=1 Tax=Methylorubrum populi TaxID=223967 RepID=A0A833J2Q1_9HYPH|nr:hypothetical protein F8B43_5307 [Methylorubrum populi]
MSIRGRSLGRVSVLRGWRGLRSCAGSRIWAAPPSAIGSGVGQQWG